MEALRGAPEVQLLEDCEEVAQVPYFDFCHCR
jgi:hypothetical protein